MHYQNSHFQFKQFPSFLATCYETENKHATSILGKQKNYIIKE